MEELTYLKNALNRLKEAIDEDYESSVIIDGTIQRFEFTYEIFWKTLKKLLAKQGIITNSPKQTLSKAYQLEWIDDEDLWLNMLNDRNLTSHTYKEETALSIYEHIEGYHEEMLKVYKLLLTIDW